MIAKKTSTVKTKFKSRPNRPVNLVEVNCDSASGVPSGHSQGVLKAASKNADIVLACECFNIRGNEILSDFHVAQFGKRGSKEAGSIVALRKTRGYIVEQTLVFGVAGIKVKRVRDRYWLRTKLRIDNMKPSRFSSGHAHPKRAWVTWGPYMARAPWGVLGFDANKRRPALVARFPGRNVRQIGVLTVIVPRYIPVTKARSLDVGGDHKAVAVTLWPNA